MRWVVFVLVFIGSLQIVGAQSDLQFAYFAETEQGYTLTLVNPADGQTHEYPLPNAGSWLADASVSPDGSEILLWFNNYPREGSQASVLRHLHLATGELRDIAELPYYHDDWGTADSYGFFPLWSPDSHYVLHFDQLYNFASHTMDVLPTTPLARAWSLDSQRLAIGQRHCEETYCRGIEVQLLQMPEMHVIQTASTNDWAELCNFNWSPDETMLVFEVHCSYLESGLRGYGELMAWDLASNTISPLTDYTTSPQEYYEQIGAVRDGGVDYSALWLTPQFLLTSIKHWDFQPGTDSYEVNPSTFTVQTSLHTFPANAISVISDEWIEHWALNPVTQQIVYQTQRITLDAAGDIAHSDVRMEIATFNGKKLVVEQQLPAGCQPMWSPDGAWLVFSGLVKDEVTHYDQCGERLYFSAANQPGVVQHFPLPDNALLAGWVHPIVAEPLFFPAGTPTPVPTVSGYG
jgi:hypothetical protein